MKFVESADSASKAPVPPALTIPEILHLIENDPERMRILRAVHALHLPDSWIGGGFIRNLVWDHLHEIHPRTPLPFIDVVYFQPENLNEAFDHELEVRLHREIGGIRWQVQNQARMHTLNEDEPYLSSADAISKWPETATAVACKLNDQGKVELLAPLGIDDLVHLNLCPTPHTLERHKQDLIHERIAKKNWLVTWPKLKNLTL